MTTICYRDGVMAADSRAYAGDRLPIGFKTKIRATVVDDVPFLVGVSTPAPGFGEVIHNWFAAGYDYHDSPPMVEGGFVLLAVDAAGQGWFARDSFYLSGPLTAPWWVIGSGDEFAVGALERGATAIEAVEIARKFDQWTDGPIDTLSFVEQDDKLSILEGQVA